MNEKTIGLISIFAGGLPAIAGIIIFTKARFKHRMLIIFILYGFLSDLSRWQLYEHGYFMVQRSLFYIYALIESVFFCWFIYKTCDYRPVSKAALSLIPIFLIIWAFSYFDFTGLTWRKETSEALFTTIYEMTVSVLAAYTILRLTQRSESLSSLPDFWFLSAIFFYCFCTFFVGAFLQTPQMNKFWFIHDLFNIMTCFIFTVGFYKIETSKE